MPSPDKVFPSSKVRRKYNLLRQGWCCLIFISALMVMNCSTKVSDKPREAITLLDTTVTNSGVRFYLTLTSNTDTSAILKSSVGTKESIIDIMDQPTSLGAVELIDFDKNGSADILASYIGNVPFFMLYLFDSTTASFRRVHHFDRFPESQQLESDHSLYYSYQ